MLNPIELRRLRCWDGLHYSFQMLHLSQESLWETCCAIPGDSSKAILGLVHCWNFIDSLHRIREIAQATPGLNTKDLESRVFLEATSITEEYRHYIQHLRQELNREPPNSFPVWGSLSWVDSVDSSKSYIAHLGAQIPGMQYSGCVFDTHDLKWVSRVCLGIDRRSFNFDPIYEAAVRFESLILPNLLQSFSPDVQRHDKLPIMSIIIQYTNEHNKSLHVTASDDAARER